MKLTEKEKLIKDTIIKICNRNNKKTVEIGEYLFCFYSDNKDKLSFVATIYNYDGIIEKRDPYFDNWNDWFEYLRCSLSYSEDINAIASQVLTQI